MFFFLAFFLKKRPGELRFEGHIPTCCVSFTFTTTLVKSNNRRVTTFRVKDKFTEITYAKTNEAELQNHDIKFMVSCLPPGTTKKDVDALFVTVPISVERFQELPIFTKLKIQYRTEYFRYEYEKVLFNAMPEQKTRIRKMKDEHFEEAYRLVQKTPWLLCFLKHVHPIKLKEMSYKGLCRHIVRSKRPVNPMFMCAIRLYTYLKDKRLEGNSVFAREGLYRAYLSDEEWRRVAWECNDNTETLDKAFPFVFFNGFDGLDENGCETRDLDRVRHICFPKDLYRCQQIVYHLRSLGSNDPQKRNTMVVPCFPRHILTETQQDFIKHVYNNKFSFLLGGPGTGKSECLVALMALFSRPLVVTYVGMMVDSLQKRFNGRVETVHTIHSIYYASQNVPLWLSQFDMIIIDEFSNVDEHLFAKLLISVPKNTRLVCVGDLGQIYPIKPGCPFKDLVTAFPEHVYRLVENKRVDPDALELSRASDLINQNRPKEIVFQGPLQLVPPNDEQVKAWVLEKAKYGIMTSQVVVLINKDRKHLNKLVEEALIEHGYLSPHMSTSSCTIRGADGRMDLFVGKKISFCKNTKGTEEYAGVRNGELGEIAGIQGHPGTTMFIELTNGKEIKVGGTDGVDPNDICAGYVTTCNKAQGSEWLHILFYVYENPR